MKTPYTFSILRYVHDIVTGEFVNVGVILFAPKAKYLSASCTTKYRRISNIFTDFNSEHFRKSVKYIQTTIQEEGARLLNELPFKEPATSAKGFAARILPINDSSLQFSPEGYGMTDNPEKTLQQVFNRYVEKYYGKSERTSRTNEDVWKVYQKPLKEKKVLEHLKPHKLAGLNYEHEFKHCWKNHRWHVNQPISFDLVDAHEILDKANTWKGRIESLLEGGEKFKINVLLGSPHDSFVTPSFIKAQNILNTIPCEREFFKEDEAEEFAENIRQEIEAHFQ
jgi:hypothetical protein